MGKNQMDTRVLSRYRRRQQSARPRIGRPPYDVQTEF